MTTKTYYSTKYATTRGIVPLEIEDFQIRSTRRPESGPFEGCISKVPPYLAGTDHGDLNIGDDAFRNWADAAAEALYQLQRAEAAVYRKAERIKKIQRQISTALTDLELETSRKV